MTEAVLGVLQLDIPWEELSKTSVIDSETVPVYIPYDNRAKGLIEYARKEEEVRGIVSLSPCHIRT